MKNKKWIRLCFFVILSVLLAACSAGSSNSDTDEAESTKPDTEELSTDNEIVIAIDENAVTLDPHNSRDRNSKFYHHPMYEALIEYNEDGEFVKVLAEDYTQSDDGTEYTFYLREGVVFHDGTPFNAEAAKVNIDRLIDESNNLRGNSDFAFVEKAEVVDEYTVKVILEKPYSSMLDKFTQYGMISPQALDEYGEEIDKNPVGTGPFKFVEWQQGSHFIVEKYEDYWQEGLPKVDRIEFKPVQETGTRVAMLKTGEADFIFPFPEESLEEAEGQDEFSINQSPSTIAYFVMLNTMKKPFDDVRVRQALNYAIDQEAYVNIVKGGYGEPMDSIVPNIMSHHETQENLYNYDPEKAKELLNEAGYGDGVSVEIWGNSTSGNMRGMQFIQQQLAEVGVDVNINAMEEGTLHGKIYDEDQTPEEAEVEMWYVSWSQSDIDGFVRPAFSSQEFPPRGVNASYYQNNEVDDWITEAMHTGDVDEQAALYSNVQSTVYEEAPWIFLATENLISGKRNNIEGISNLPSGTINAREAEIN